MNIEDQLRQAGRAVTEQVRHLPELTLPPASSGARPGARQHRTLPRSARGARSGWLIPLTAAAAIIAVAATLVATRTLHVSTSPAASHPAGQNDSAVGSPNAIPRYFVAFGAAPRDIAMVTQARKTADVVDSRTGKLLAQVKAPEDGVFTDVGGGADDRTFVLADSPAMGRFDSLPTGRFDLYLLHLVPGAAHPAQLTKLPIKTVTGQPVGIAVAPDDRELAVGWMSALSNTLTLRVYSLPSGSVLGTWTKHGDPAGALGLSGGVGLSWLADGRSVAFTLREAPGFGGDLDVRTLNVTQPSGDLLTESRVALPLRGTHTATESNPACAGTLLTPDGGTVVCGKYSPVMACTTHATGLVAYSVAAGKPARVLYSYRGKCVSGFGVSPLWTNESARDVIALVQTGKREIGLLANGRITRISSYPFLNVAAGDYAF